MVGTGCWFGKAETKAKFYSFPSCSFLQLSMCLLASPCLSPLLPIPLCTCLGARNTYVGADGFYSGVERLHGSHWSVPSGMSAAHPVPQGFCLFFGLSGLWTVTLPFSCARSKFIFQLLIFGQLHMWPQQAPSGQRLYMVVMGARRPCCRKHLDVGFILFLRLGSFLGKYKIGFKQMCLTAAHASAMQNLQDTSFFCKHC